MYPLMVLLSALAILGSVVTMSVSNREPLPPVEGTASALADNFFVYSDSVARYVATQPIRYTAPSADNSVPDAALSFPTWYQRNSRWNNKVIDGVVTIYSTTPYNGPGLSAELTRRTQGSYRAGITASDLEIISFQHGPTGIIAPTGVPANVAVYQMVVHQ